LRRGRASDPGSPGEAVSAAVAAVHFDRPKAGFVALALFAAMTTVAYTSLVMIDDPYRYPTG
jgi:hypothetical protein